MKCNLDKLTNASPHKGSVGAIMQLSNTQGRSPEQQAMAAAVVFTQICEHLQIEPSQLHQYALNIQQDQGSRRPEFRAVTQFIKEQL